MHLSNSRDPIEANASQARETGSFLGIALTQRAARLRKSSQDTFDRAPRGDKPLERWVERPDGTRLCSFSVGEGPAVVLCDALGCDGFAWPHLRRALPNFKVISWHYRGHGKSSPVDDFGKVDMRMLRDDLLAVLDAHGVTRARLVGYSLGAHVMFDFATHNASRVESLASLCGNAGGRLELLRPGRPVSLALRAVLAVNRALRGAGPVGLWLWRHFVSTVVYGLAVCLVVRGSQAYAKDFRPYFDHLGRIDARFFADLLEKMQAHDRRSSLQNISAPTLLLAGSNDVMAPKELSAHMHEKISDSEFKVFDGASHLLPLEKHREVGECLADFFQRSHRR